MDENKKLCEVLYVNVSNEVTSAHQGYIYVLKNTVKTVILWNSITI